MWGRMGSMGLPHEDWRYFARPAMASGCLWLLIGLGLGVVWLIR